MSLQKKRMASKGGTPTALARVSDPLITPDGKKVDPEGYVNGKKLPSTPPPMDLDAKNFRPVKKRSLKELPADVPLINGVGAIFMYTVLGVGDREIADALKVTTYEVEQVRNHSAYKECFDMVVATFIDKNSDLLAARIAAYSHSALDTVGNIALNGKKEENQLRASIDLMDRAGVKAKDNAERNRGNSANDLRIVIVEPAKDANITINIDTGGFDGDSRE